MNKPRLVAVAAAAGITAGWLLIGELSHALAHSQALGRPVCRPGYRQAVIVLGYPTRPDGSPHPLQRWRAEIAARSLDPAADVVVICTGGPDHSGRTEAATLAELLSAAEVAADQIVLEERATSTWQNIEFSLPWLADADVIVIASNSLHARRARHFLARQRPDLATRLAAADDYRFGEYWWLKTPLAIYEAIGAWREWRHPRLRDKTG